MKAVPAVLFSLFMSAVIGGSILLIGGNALLNNNSTPISNAPASAPTPAASDSQQQQAIQQLHLVAGEAVEVDGLRRPRPAVHDPARQVVAIILGKRCVPEPPGGLPRQAPAVADGADHVEALQALHDVVRPEQVQQVHVVVREDEVGRVAPAAVNRRVVQRGQAGAVPGVEFQFDERMRKQRQRAAEGRLRRKPVAAGTGRTDDFEGRFHSISRCRQAPPPGATACQSTAPR